MYLGIINHARKVNTMTRTYYECLNEAGKPATPRQTRAYGTPAYGYRSRVLAELSCPNGCVVAERHENKDNDWAGCIVSMRTHEGHLIRLV